MKTQKISNFCHAVYDCVEYPKAALPGRHFFNPKKALTVDMLLNRAQDILRHRHVEKFMPDAKSFVVEVSHGQSWHERAGKRWYKVSRDGVVLLSEWTPERDGPLSVGSPFWRKSRELLRSERNER